MYLDWYWIVIVVLVVNYAGWRSGFSIGHKEGYSEKEEELRIDQESDEKEE